MLPLIVKLILPDYYPYWNWSHCLRNEIVKPPGNKLTYLSNYLFLRACLSLPCLFLSLSQVHFNPSRLLTAMTTPLFYLQNPPHIQSTQFAMCTRGTSIMRRRGAAALTIALNYFVPPQRFSSNSCNCIIKRQICSQPPQRSLLGSGHWTLQLSDSVSDWLSKLLTFQPNS